MSREAASPDPESLARALGPLLAHGQADLSDLGLEAALLQELGFEVSAGWARIPEGIERLDAQRIEAELSEGARSWLRELLALEVVGSTSTLLNEMVGAGSLDGLVRLAELQLQGRGRRGRGWMSPYANNLAMSLGARLPQRPDQLGGFSLCAGLAVADRLQLFGVPGVELKWPNDVLVHGAKVAGILIELHGVHGGSEVVIGVGVNFRLPAAVKQAIDQPITDLADSGRQLSRNEVAAGLISSLVDFIHGFSEYGFEPMRSVFNDQHRFHGRDCTLLTSGGTLTGRVRGVTGQGELLMERNGRLETYNSGEVSLRPA